MGAPELKGEEVIVACIDPLYGGVAGMLVGGLLVVLIQLFVNGGSER